MKRKTHSQSGRLNLSHGEASYVSIFSHCSTVSLSACRPASCKMEGEKNAISGQFCKTEYTALSYCYTEELFYPKHDDSFSLGFFFFLNFCDGVLVSTTGCVHVVSCTDIGNLNFILKSMGESRAANAKTANVSVVCAKILLCTLVEEGILLFR